MMGSRYGKLPSQILESATTLDYEVMNIYSSWEKQCRERAENESKGIKPVPQLPPEQLQAMIDRVRNNNS